MMEHAREAGAEPLLAYARVALGELAIGIDTRHVVRALARPPALARLPRSHGAIDGVFSDGAQAIPVVDLRKWMGETADAAPAQILVLGAQGRRIGLAIDTVRGLVRARASQLQRVHHEQVEDDFFHSVLAAGDGDLLSVLDPLQLMARVQAWTASTDAASDAASDAVQAQAAPEPLQALVRIGATVLALPAALVAQVLDRPEAQPLLGAGRELLGMIQWRGRHLPLVDLGALLGIDSGPAPLVAIVAQDDLLVALPVDEVVAVRALPADSAAAAPDAGIDHPLVRAIALLGDEEEPQRVLQIDTEALLRTHAAPGLSRQEAIQDASARSAKRAPAHVVFDTGRRWAIAMAALEAILPLPDTMDGDAGAMPTFAWRGRSLPLIDLREGPDDAACQGPQRVLVVRHADRHAALRVHDVVELLSANTGELLAFQAAGGARVQMITVGEGIDRISYPVLELDTLPFFSAS
ncbi:chemotaxis protein CheW [Massilia norwichensis]|uniref:Chemotaxis protein CheW n=1 Tax=Massilia norwichensis TaxID=1442366 RepID=A0ABT2AAE6_9BURK|nr:chemotaxis protein CheW [Massilia norwichensis]MCS0590760.1 chemotaxis protein CheW [Massilia norwichensis]